MNLQERLKRLQTNLELFDLETFFHDETFFYILEDREVLEAQKNELSKKELIKLYHIDKIIDSYYNLYKDENLDGYAKMSFKLLENVEAISHANISQMVA